MKKTKEFSKVEVIYGENETAKLNFIKFLVDYFFEKQIAEVIKNNDKSSKESEYS